MLTGNVGYELAVVYALSLFWTPWGYGQRLDTETQVAWKTNRIHASGSLIVGGTVYFLKACYLTMLFKAPVESLIQLNRSRSRYATHQEWFYDGGPTHNYRFTPTEKHRLVYGARVLCTSLIEFSFGIGFIALQS